MPMPAHPDNTERARNYQAIIDSQPVLGPITWDDVQAADECRRMLEWVERIKQKSIMRGPLDSGPDTRLGVEIPRAGELYRR